MRFVAPARNAVDAAAFDRPPLADWSEFASLLRDAQWPGVAELNAAARARHAAGGAGCPCFVEQTRGLLDDGLHYEQRIAERGAIATRTGNWHDLLNALVWLRFPQLKAALNARQVAEIAIAGPKRRTRAQCALTHFDEAGVVACVRDPALLALWDEHDWPGLFRRERDAWRDGRIDAIVFGHALLEHALRTRQLLVGKALVVLVDSGTAGTLGAGRRAAVDAVAGRIRDGALLRDPQELRPLPLSGIPGWHADNADEAFYRSAACFRPLRAGRRYPAPV